jgi:hypothetical protein
MTTAIELEGRGLCDKTSPHELIVSHGRTNTRKSDRFQVQVIAQRRIGETLFSTTAKHLHMHICICRFDIENNRLPIAHNSLQLKRGTR